MSVGNKSPMVTVRVSAPRSVSLLRFSAWSSAFSRASLVLHSCIYCISFSCCYGPVRCAVISRRSAGARSPRCSRRGCWSRWCAATLRTLCRTSSEPSTASTTPKTAWLYGESRRIEIIWRNWSELMSARFRVWQMRVQKTRRWTDVCVLTVMQWLQAFCKLSEGK